MTLELKCSDSIQVKVYCGSIGCQEEIELTCSTLDEAEQAVLSLDGWFVVPFYSKYVCPIHAEAARNEWAQENPQHSGIQSTLVG